MKFSVCTGWVCLPKTSSGPLRLSRGAHVTHYTASLHLIDFKCASNFGEAQHGLRPRAPRRELSLNQGRANDTGLGGSYDDVSAWSLDVQRIDSDRSASSARRAGLLVDDEADAAWQRDGEVWVGYEDGLARGDQADELSIPGDGSLSIAASSPGVRFHDIGSNQTTQQT